MISKANKIEILAILRIQKRHFLFKVVIIYFEKCQNIDFRGDLIKILNE